MESTCEMAMVPLDEYQLFQRWKEEQGKRKEHHKEYMKEYMKEYREQNREKYNAKKREWYQKQKEKKQVGTE